MYVPNNPAVYSAAFGGAFAAMTASMRIPTSTSTTAYDNAAKAAGAWAESFDTAWGSKSANSNVLNSIADSSEVTWDSRVPPNTPDAQTASTYTDQVLALIASITAATAYLGDNVWPFPQGSIDADYILVGLGTAGAPLARYLTDDMVTTVAVFEAGENHSTDPSILAGAPFGDPSIGANPRFSWARPADPSDINVGLAGIYAYGDGRMWGGSSGHNGLVAVRSSPDVYNEWGLIDPKWSYNNLLPIMKAMETYTPNGTVANPAVRGHSGPLNITQDPPLPLADPFYASIIAAANVPAISDYNDATLGDIGLAAEQWWVNSINERIWSLTAFLPPTVLNYITGLGVGNRKLQVTSSATVIEIVTRPTNNIGGLEAVGIRYILADRPGEVFTATAKKKVILCAGATANPQLLQVSGIGDPALLTSLGIPVKRANVNVGINLQNHYGITALIPCGANPSPPFNVGHIYSDLSGAGTGQAHDSVRRYEFTTLPANFFIPRAILTALGIQNDPSISFLGFLMTPNRLGTIKAVSADPLTMPEIKCSFYKDVTPVTDLERNVQAYKVVANISMAYSGLPPLYPPQSHYPAPWGPAPNDDLLKDDAKNVSLIAAYHNVGTCRMATSAATGVVDGNLDVFGVSKLACCDNSVVPTITKGNTAYPAYLVGLKKAQIEGAIIP